MIVTFGALVVGVILVDKGAAVVPHCKLVVALELDGVTAYGVDVFDACVVVTFHLDEYLVAVAVLNLLGRIEVHVDVVLLVLPVL